MSGRKKLVVLTGAGISYESGIETFRSAQALWEKFDIMEVATPQGWKKDKSKVLDFYNDRREQLNTVEPNAGHKALVDAEQYLDVVIITQNVDDLHERAGSKDIIHLHGELRKVRSTVDPTLVYDIGYTRSELGDKCEKGSQLRPHIVWFGEAVPNMSKAYSEAMNADFVMVVGTSLAVWPAADIATVNSEAKTWYVDPDAEENLLRSDFSVDDDNFICISESATIGVAKALEEIKKLL